MSDYLIENYLNTIQKLEQELKYSYDSVSLQLILRNIPQIELKIL